MPGITLLKYYSPPDFAYPDEVSISNISQAYFQPINPQGLYLYFSIRYVTATFWANLKFKS